MQNCTAVLAAAFSQQNLVLLSTSPVKVLALEFICWSWYCAFPEGASSPSDRYLPRQESSVARSCIPVSSFI